MKLRTALRTVSAYILHTFQFLIEIYLQNIHAKLQVKRFIINLRYPDECIKKVVSSKTRLKFAFAQTDLVATTVKSL